VLGEIYALAEKLKDNTSKDTVLSAMLAKSKEPSADCNQHSRYPSLTCINIVYSGTPSGSPARRLLVDLYAETVDSSSSFSAYGSAHKDFMFDMMVSLASTRPHAKVPAELRNKLITETSKSTAKDGQIAERDMMLVDLRSENTTLKKNVATLTEERDAARKKLETLKYAKVERVTAGT
jgi:hypothetical protein